MIPNVEDFLACRRIAIVGVSRHSKDFSRMVFRAFRERGFDAVVVNPGIGEVEGQTSYPRLQDVQPPVDAALLMTPPALTPNLVRDCIAAGIERVWMYRRSPEAEELCATAGLATIAGECPLMFLPDAGWIHRLHRWIKRV